MDLIHILTHTHTHTYVQNEYGVKKMVRHHFCEYVSESNLVVVMYLIIFMCASSTLQVF